MQGAAGHRSRPLALRLGSTCRTETLNRTSCGRRSGHSRASSHAGYSNTGDYGGGTLWPTRELVEDYGRMCVYCAATERLHRDPFATHNTIYALHAALCCASWEVDRYWAAVSAAGGTHEVPLTSFLLPAGGKRLSVNAATSTVGEGELVAELLDAEGQTTDGSGHAYYPASSGEDKARTLRWSGGAACPVDHAAVRFYVKRARLYGFGWV